MKATATPQVVCGACAPCLRGDYHICDHLRVRGFQAPGAAQDLFLAPAADLVPLPDDFTFEQGAFVEPVAVAIHATARAGNLAGANVVVLGAGPIGNLVAQMARARGANVLITDVSAFRLRVAGECGLLHSSNAASETLRAAADRVFGSDGFGVVFDCAGVQATIDAAVAEVAKGGLIVAVAVYDEKPRVDMAVVGDRELRIVGTLMYQHADYVEAVRRLTSGEVVTKPLETIHFPFEAYAEAYAFIDREGQKAMKVFIDL